MADGLRVAGPEPATLAREVAPALPVSLVPLVPAPRLAREAVVESAEVEGAEWAAAAVVE
jgi:hypothetical protein